MIKPGGGNTFFRKEAGGNVALEGKAEQITYFLCSSLSLTKSKMKVCAKSLAD